MSANEEKYRKNSSLLKDILVNGDLETTDDLILEGRIVGSIHSKAIVEIGEEGVLEGDVNCIKLELKGSVNGNVKTVEAIIREKAVIRGTLHTVRLMIHPDAVLEKGINIQELEQPSFLQVYLPVCRVGTRFIPFSEIPHLVVLIEQHCWVPCFLVCFGGRLFLILIALLFLLFTKPTKRNIGRD